MKSVEVYTDGSYSLGRDMGGIGIYFLYEGREYMISKGYINTTISRLELMAIVESLRLIDDKNININIYSDSAYVINSINNKWVDRWENENFVGRKNSDLWKLFLKERRQHKGVLVFKHVRGHQGIIGNEIADTLADYTQHEIYIRDLKITR